jgi:hypothetical protein
MAKKKNAVRKLSGAKGLGSVKTTIPGHSPNHNEVILRG